MAKFNRMREFFADEDGAITVDWVVLTAAIIGLALIVVIAIATSTTNLADVISADIASTPDLF